MTKIVLVINSSLNNPYTSLGQLLDIEKFSAQTKNSRQFCILAGAAGLSSKHLAFGRGRSEEAPGERLWSCFYGFPHPPFVNAAVHNSLVWDVLICLLLFGPSQAVPELMQ